ncbi:MAG: hypothetical protein MR038_09655 [Oscillospiraceae bacterium]|nr:hypothetical protein [Oscillospiraceae bacterium]
MTVIPFFEYTLYEMFHYFLIWSFIGWVIEIIDMTFETGEYQNRGFLNMPICPIYGVGVLLIIAILRPLKGTVIALFICSTVICTGIELGVGLLMEAVFHSRWWDYSHMFFNYKGLICLRNSLFFGFGCVIMMNTVQPFFEKVVHMIPVNIGIGIILVMAVLIVIDLVASVKAVKNLNDKLKQLDAIGSKMLALSQKIGGVLADGTINVRENYDKIKQKTDAAAEKLSNKIEEVKNSREEAEKPDPKEEYSLLREKYEKLLDEKSSAYRLIRAFPTIRNKKYDKPLEDLKKHVNPDSAEHFELRLDEVKRKRERHHK